MTGPFLSGAAIGVPSLVRSLAEGAGRKDTVHMVDVAVVGVGRVGAALAVAWQRTGCDVALVGHDLDSSAVISLAVAHGFRRMLMGDALVEARAVVFADPREDIETLFAGAPRSASRAVVIDASDVPDAVVSNVPALQAHGRGAPVYRLFNPIGWPDAVTVGGTPGTEVFYAGPDDDGRDIVEGLLGRLGLAAVFMGGSDCIELGHTISRLQGAQRAVAVGPELAR